MPKPARRYDVYLPLTYNDGRLIEVEKFARAERALLEGFEGLTSQQREFPFRGMWKLNSELFIDQVILMSVLDFRPRGSTKFVAQLKKQLLADFDQLEILITETALRVH